MYPAEIVEPMRKELTDIGVQELRSAAEVESLINSKPETLLVVVNSVCGCAAGAARPGVALSLTSEKKPAKVATVFAGVDKEATDKLRSYFTGYPPSSPCIGFFKNGEFSEIMQRQDIEGHSADEIAGTIQSWFEKHC